MFSSTIDTHLSIDNRLKDQEAKLDKISNEQDVHVDNLISLVKENQTTIDGLKVRGFADVVTYFIYENLTRNL